jgi:hypothetical protein
MSIQEKLLRLEKDQALSEVEDWVEKEYPTLSFRYLHVFGHFYTKAHLITTLNSLIESLGPTVGEARVLDLFATLYGFCDNKKPVIEFGCTFGNKMH